MNILKETNFDRTQPHWEHKIPIHFVSSINDVDLVLKHLYGEWGYTAKAHEEHIIVYLNKEDKSLARELDNRGVLKGKFSHLTVEIEIVPVDRVEDGPYSYASPG
jgi:hypothetical protein